MNRQQILEWVGKDGRLGRLIGKQQRLVALLAYNTLFWVAFWLFCYWTFPYERVAAYLVDRVAQSGKGYALEIGDLSPYWLTGVELTDVRLQKLDSSAADLRIGGARVPAAALPAGKDQGNKDAAAAASGMRIREVRARLGLFSLLTGDKTVDFDADLEAGEIEGSFADDDELQHLQAKLDEIDLEKSGALESLIPLPAKGTLSGDIDLSLGKDPKQTEGEIELKLAGLTLGDGKAKLKVGSMGGLTVDPIEIGNLSLEIEVKSGVGVIKKISSDGKDLELSGSGDVRFADPIGRTRLSIVLRAKFTDNYRNKSPRTRAMFSLLDSGMPEANAAKTPDGALQFRVSGTLSSPRVLPSGSPAPGRRAQPAAPPPLPNDDEAE
jgi:type II secretion system protein N